jgi:hypothetical protein
LQNWSRTGAELNHFWGGIIFSVADVCRTGAELEKTESLFGGNFEGNTRSGADLFFGAELQQMSKNTPTLSPNS